MTTSRKTIAVAAVMAVLTFMAGAAVALEVNQSVTSEGLTLLHVERDNVPVVVVKLLVRAGAARERPEIAGVASLTSKLLTEGTDSRTSKELSEEVEFMGASLSTSSGQEHSMVLLRVLKKDLQKGMELFSDVVLKPTFPEEELQRKRTRMKGMLRQMEEDPSFVANREYEQAVFGEHPYGRHSMGSPETLDAIDRKDVVAYHEQYYVPNNSIMAIVGDITELEAERLVIKYLNDWKRGHVERLEVSPPPAPERKIITVDRDLTQANIILGHVNMRRDNPDYYSMAVLNFILGGGGFSSRLMVTVRDKMGLVYDIHSSVLSHILSGTFKVVAQTKNASANTVIAEVFRHLSLLQSEKVTPGELEDAKAFIIGSFPRRLDTMGKIADYLVFVEFYGLGLDYEDKFPQYVSGVTADDVLRVARKHLRPQDIVIVVVADQEEAAVNEGKWGAEGAPLSR